MMILEIFQHHNEQMEMLIGKEYALSTVKKYKTAYKHIKNFLAYKFKRKNIPIERLNHSFITNFEFYLKIVKNCNHNSAIIYIKNFKKIVIIALSNGWINKDHVEVINRNVLLPVLSNQKSNAYLREIADLCGINKT